MNYKFQKKMVLRTPLNPLKSDFTVDDLKEIFSSKKGKDALFLASPDLSVEFDRWIKGEVKNKAKEDKLIGSLFKYASRMHSRCTPFGLFAKCSIIEWGEENKITLKEEDLNRSTRLDMHFSCQLAQELAKKKYIKPHLLFYPNTSLYNVSDKIRYIDYSYKNKQRVYQISAVDSSVYINKILLKAKEGATLFDLSLVLPEYDTEITLEESQEFVNQLIDEQLLVSEIEPSVSGEELLVQILVILNRIFKISKEEELGKMIQFLKEIEKDIVAIDAEVFNDTENYKKLAKKLDVLDIPYELSKLFQTDLFSSSKAENVIDKTIQNDMRKALRVFNKLSELSTKGNLNSFQEKFYERYEEAEVPLLTVLDNEAGIGYANNTNHTGDFSPLVNDLGIGGGGGGGAAQDGNEIKWNTKESFLFQKLMKAQKEGLTTITIEEKELKDYKEDWTNLPDTISMMFRHLGDKIVMGSVGGSSAINLLGRFASSNDEIYEIVKELAEQEKSLNSDKLIAEIVHLPETRTGNILMRPSFREYEIPYLSKSDLPAEQQLELSDLYLSVRNNKFYLRSKKYDKEVLPRLANAHNYSFRSLPVYHFLCDLQTQSMRGGIYFNWGVLQNEFRFLPRVEIGNVIAEKATWSLRKKDYEKLLEKDVDLTKAIAEWQKEWKLPDLVLLAEGDNELLLNLKNDLSIKTLMGVLHKRPSVKLIEFLYTDENAIARNGENKGFSNEIVVALTRESKEVRVAPEQDEVQETTQRNFTLGSEWLYYKIYCGSKTADEILTEVVKPLTEDWIEKGWIDKWFFIRYGDPHMHIRVRFHFADRSHLGNVILAFNQGIEEYVSNGLIWRLQSDTYQRELERYGSKTMEMAEEIFYHDSHSIVSILDMIDRDGEGEKIRWLFAVRAVDELMNVFQFDLATKKEIAERLRDSFGKEFGMNKHLNKAIDKKFRADKKDIENILNRETDHEGELVPLYELLADKTERIKPIVEHFLAMHEKGELEVEPQNLVSSYIHMLLNRLFKNKQRLHELVIYDFLWRKFKSEHARAQHIAKAKEKAEEKK